MKARKPAVPPPWVQLAQLALDLSRTDPVGFRWLVATLDLMEVRSK